MNKNIFITPLSSHDANNQAKIAIVLMSIVPSLSLFYLGSMIWSQTEQVSFYIAIIILSCTIIVAVSGYLILRKYPKNIIKLRQSIAEISTGILPDKIRLLQTRNSDDLMFIEDGLNLILKEMRDQMELTQQKLDVEHALREIGERQQQDLLQAERHRAMVQSLGAVSHHIGQSATTLKRRLHLLKEMTSSDDELAEIEECEKELHSIMQVLDKQRTASEFKTEPYTSGEVCDDSEILAS